MQTVKSFVLHILIHCISSIVTFTKRAKYFHCGLIAMVKGIVAFVELFTSTFDVKG